MPRLNDMFPSKFLTAADLDGKNVTVTISGVEMEKMRDGAVKPCLTTDELDKGFICNKTNAKTIGSLYGDDTDDWIGQRITLYAAKVLFDGEMVDSIQVKPTVPRDPKKATTTKATPPAQPKRRPAPVATDDSEDIDEETAEDDIPF